MTARRQHKSSVAAMASGQAVTGGKIRTSLRLVNPYMPSRDSSRPNQDRFTLPNGRSAWVEVAVVNHDGFELDSDLEEAYLDAVQEMGDTYFHGVTRFTTSAFMRAKLGSALESRSVAPHIYESEDEAASAVRTTLPRQE
jgi:hypothetical protein